MTGHRFGTSAQFHRVVLRMMPEWASSIPEGKLIAAILSQAWYDGWKDENKRFFMNENGQLERYCSVSGILWERVKEMYENSCRKVRH